MRPTPRTVALAVAALILVVGGAYVAKHHEKYQSSATFALAPAPGTPATLIANELSGFGQSATSGTFVDLIASADTARDAGLDGSGVTISVRADPTARAIYVTAEGPQDVVQPALQRVVRTSIARQALVNDVFRLSLIDSPSAPTPSGPSRAVLALAVVLLAVLGGLFVLVVLRRYPPGPARATGATVVLGAGGAGGAGALPAGDAYRVLGGPQDVTFHLEAFRFVRASLTTTLMQIMGYWRGVDDEQDLPDPVLLVHDGHVAHTIASVDTPGERPPKAGPDAPLWRASYAVPVEIFNRYQRLALRSGDVIVGLPQPTEHLSLRPADPHEVEELRRGIRRPDDEFGAPANGPAPAIAPPAPASGRPAPPPANGPAAPGLGYRAAPPAGPGGDPAAPAPPRGPGGPARG